MKKSLAGRQPLRSFVLVLLAVALGACGTIYRRPGSDRDRQKPQARLSDVPGYVVSPYSGQYVSVENIPPQVLVHDPTSGREFYYPGERAASRPLLGRVATGPSPVQSLPATNTSRRGNSVAFRHAYYGRMSEARAAAARGEGTDADIESGLASAKRDRNNTNLVGGILWEMAKDRYRPSERRCEMCGRGEKEAAEPGSDGLCVNCRGTVMGR